MRMHSQKYLLSLNLAIVMFVNFAVFVLILTSKLLVPSPLISFILNLTTATLRSSSTSLLDVRPSRRVTVGDRSFATAGPRIWNTLPRDVTTATSLLSFRPKLKTHLFRQSYPDIVV